MDLLVIGDCSIDQYMDIDDSAVLQDPETQEEKICFLHGSKVLVQKFHLNLAGNAAHVGVACKRLGLNTAVYTELGADDYGERFLKEFSKEGLNTKYIHLNKDHSTNVHAIVWHAGDRTIFSYHEPREYGINFDTLEKPKWIYYTSLAQGFENFQIELVEYIKRNEDIGIAFNPGSYQLTKMEEVRIFIQVTDVLFVNKEEAVRITGTNAEENTSTEELHKKLHAFGCKMSVITEGKNGSSVYDGMHFIKKDILPVEKVVDKTGAGDTYAASFISALHYGKNLETAMDWGNKNSASTVQYVGCLPGLLTIKQIES